jgi:hypothetical protein
MTHPLTAGVEPLFTGKNISAYYESEASMLIATVSGGAAVAVTHPYGDGSIVVIASDFSVTGTELDRVLANAVRLGTKRVSSPVAITPLTTTLFSNGEWSGVVSLMDQGYDLRFSATDGNTQTNHSNLFDAKPLRLAPMERNDTGEIVLRWESAGVTRYSIEGSPTLLPGSFVSVLTNLLASPPSNVVTGRVDNVDGVFYRLRVETP